MVGAMNAFSDALEQRRAQGLWRDLTPLLHAPGKYVVRTGVTCLNCASNNYLDLAGHPALRAKAAEALEEAGTGSGGSRLLGGNLPLHEQLEAAVARYRPMGRALLFNSGFQANQTAVSALGDALGGVFADKLAHASVAEGLRSLSAPFHRFRHNDMNHLEALLQKRQPAAGGLVVTETLFSMDGDFAPLAELVELQRRYGFWLYLDEAHSTGCYSDLHLQGFQGQPDRVVLMGTFGKALGGFGAYVVGPSEAIDFLINFGPGFIFSTALPPAVLGSNLAALELVQSQEEAWRPERLHAVASLARAEFRRRGFDLGSAAGHILPVRLGTPERAAQVAARLFDAGIHAPAVRPPTVPAGTSRLRVNLSAAFVDEEVMRLADALEQILRELDAGETPA